MSSPMRWATAPQPVRREGGYLPIADHGLIGDGTTAALVGRDGSVSWLCVPRFDGEALFCGLLDTGRGGAFGLAPDDLEASRQAYMPDTGVLVTELHGAEGVVEVTDALPLRAGADLADQNHAGRGEMLRCARVVHGRVRLHLHVDPRGGARVTRRSGGLDLDCPARPDLRLHLRANRALDGPAGVYELSAGEELQLTLSWAGGTQRYRRDDPDTVIRATAAAWRRWLRCFSYEGPQERLVRRSALTLKMLDYFPNGAIVAAPTSSLPERIGGSRNWDYRYAWVRDAAFCVYALRRIGLGTEADAFLGWLLDAVERGGRPMVLYDVDAQPGPRERLDADLEGYRSSAPVRWGNAAADQRQHDVYGEMIDCAFQWMRAGGRVDAALWDKLRALADAAGREWDAPDRGIWEVRTPGRVFTYSAAMCHVALDRAVRIADAAGLPADASWARTASDIAATIIDRAWNADLQSWTQHLDGSGGVDASLLALPLRRLVPATHPRMVATTEAVRRHLDAGGGLLHRYDRRTSPDGVAGDEGAFLLCSFWLADNLAGQGRLDEAGELYDSLCARANPLGLLPEQIDPSTGAFLGNYPQALSHVGVVSSGMNLGRRRRR